MSALSWTSAKIEVSARLRVLRRAGSQAVKTVRDGPRHYAAAPLRVSTRHSPSAGCALANFGRSIRWLGFGAPKPFPDQSRGERPLANLKELNSECRS